MAGLNSITLLDRRWCARPPQARTWSGCTAAHCGVMHGHVGVLRTLLAAGASVDAVTSATASTDPVYSAKFSTKEF